MVFAARRDPVALDRLVAEYERYALSVAARMYRRGEPREDLDQVALESLVVALHRFDPRRGVPFAGFANPTILGAIRRHYRDRGWLVRVPRTVHEVANALDMDVEDLLNAEKANFARSTAWLDAPHPDGTTIGARIGSVDPGLSTAEDRIDLGDALKDMGPPARELLRLYFFEDRTQEEVGRLLGISQMQVSRRLTTTLRHLRSRMAAA